MSAASFTEQRQKKYKKVEVKKDEAEERVGEHDMCGGLRGGKYSLYEGGTHVPFFTYSPKN